MIFRIIVGPYTFCYCLCRGFQSSCCVKMSPFIQVKSCFEPKLAILIMSYMTVQPCPLLVGSIFKNCWTTGIKEIYFYCFYCNHKLTSICSFSENWNVLSKYMALLLVKSFHFSSRFLYFFLQGYIVRKKATFIFLLSINYDIN
jgi:hypothetical protein